MIRVMMAMLLAAAIGFMMAGPVHADAEEDQLQAALTQFAPAIVGIKMVLHSDNGSGAPSDVPVETQGVAVDKTGLILTSAIIFSSSEAMMMGMGGGGGTADAHEAVPKDIKVVFPPDATEYDAFLAAKDSQLGVAFLQVQKLGGRKINPVDFTGAAAPGIGEPVVIVSRLLKGYDYSPYFETARISGHVTVPRESWLLDNSVGTLGMPVVSLAGAPIGILTTIRPGVSDEATQTAMAYSMFMRLVTGTTGGAKTFIVPGSAISPAIQQAEKRAAALEASGATTTPPAQKKPAPNKP